jgi:transcriptional regulator with XRE-family HTH domain
VGEPGLSFAGLLRQLRSEAKLTQEELAAAARLSPRSVSDLERGINRTAHKDTAVLLAGALGLAEPAGDCSWQQPVARPQPHRCWPLSAARAAARRSSG